MKKTLPRPAPLAALPLLAAVLAGCAPKPAIVAPKPAIVAPKPAIVAPKPAIVAPKPAIVAPKPAIVGKWQGTLTQPGGAISSTFEFTPDGREAITSRATGGGATVDITAGGTYKVDGAHLTQTLTTMTLRGHPMVIPPQPARPAPFTLDGDHLTLTNPGTGEALMLTRVKG